MNRSRSTLFLIEQLIVIAVFAICASICVKILADSYIMVNRSNDKSGAIRAAQNAAECFKAVSGDAENATAVLGGSARGRVVYYDKSWQTCGETEAAYVLMFETLPEETATLLLSKISVMNTGGNEIFGLTVAARRDVT